MRSVLFRFPDLREFEHLHKKAQQRGELPPDEVIEKILTELEATWEQSPEPATAPVM